MLDTPDLDPIDRRERVKVVEDTGYEAQQRVTHDPVAERRQQLFRASQLVWLIVGIICGLIGLRFLLLLIAANPNNPFAAFIYTVSGLFMWPFIGLTATPSAGGMVLEIPSLIAILIYILLGWVVVRLIWLLFDRPASRTVSTYERDEHL